MKRQTAIKNAIAIAERIRRCAGLIGTPGSSHEAVRIPRAWVFGSTAKGYENPNDLDIMLESIAVGRFRPKQAKKGPPQSGYRYRATGHDTATAYLKRGMKMVRFHDIDIDGDLGDISQTKIMIYPRNDFLRQGAQ